MLLIVCFGKNCGVFNLYYIVCCGVEAVLYSAILLVALVVNRYHSDSLLIVVIVLVLHLFGCLICNILAQCATICDTTIVQLEIGNRFTSAYVN